MPPTGRGEKVSKRRDAIPRQFTITRCGNAASVPCVREKRYPRTWLRAAGIGCGRIGKTSSEMNAIFRNVVGVVFLSTALVLRGATVNDYAEKIAPLIDPTK